MATRFAASVAFGSRTTQSLRTGAVLLLIRRKSYHIEVSNVARKGLTQLTITGPGVPGLIASMTATLAIHGGSIKELHAADSLKESGFPAEEGQIRDVITVYNYRTKKQFEDDELESLAEAVLESTRSPMTAVSIVKAELDKMKSEHTEPHPGNIKIIRKDSFKTL